MQQGNASTGAQAFVFQLCRANVEMIKHSNITMAYLLNIILIQPWIMNQHCLHAGPVCKMLTQQRESVGTT